MDKPKRQWYDLWHLKSHTVVYHRPDKRFFEVKDRYNLVTDDYIAYPIMENTGMVMTWNYNLIMRVDVEPIAPTHPVYLKWAAARLRDALEGMDR